jgi:hypothetical protein
MSTGHRGSGDRDDSRHPPEGNRNAARSDLDLARGGAPWYLPLLFITVVITYGVGSWIALRLIEASDLHGVLFISAGITVAFLLRLRRRPDRPGPLHAGSSRTRIGVP